MIAEVEVKLPTEIVKSVGAVISGGGGVVFETVTVEADDVVTSPAASRATAVSVWEPFVTVVVFQLIAYGAIVSSTPRLTPSSLN